MNPAADRFRVFCLGMALLLSPALLLAFPSLPVIQADEKQEKAAEKAFDELNEKMNQAQEAYYRPMSEAREKGLSSKEMEKIELDPNLEPVKVVGPQMLKAIEKYAGTNAALEACDRMISLAGRSEGQEWMLTKILGTLEAHYLQDEMLINIVRYAHYGSSGGEIVTFLNTVISGSPHREVQAASCYALAKIKGKKEETRSEGLALLKRVETDYGDVAYRGDRVYADKVKGDLFEMKNLQVGCVAPEIIGKEISGKLMQLSSFRGKVVLLDFWGDW
jgi:hypothetical protein